MPLSVQQFITGSLTAAKVLKPGMTPTGTQLEVSMGVHREMVHSWSARRLRLFFVPEAQYPLVVGQGTYQIGPAAADYNTSAANSPYKKPIYVSAASVIVGVARRVPMNILTRPQWDICQTKSLTDPDGPIDLFFDYNSPLATFNVACKPGTATTMFVAQWNALTGFLAGQEQFDVDNYYPLEYIKPMKYGLAIELANIFGMPVGPEITAPFQESIQELEQMNNDKLSGAYGVTRTLDGPVKGDGSPTGPPQQQGQ